MKEKKLIKSLQVMSMLVVMISILVNVAFITLLERKILGFSQLRLGPNKPSFTGMAQPAADAIKLFTNFPNKNFNHQYFYKMMPFVSLGLALILWMLVPPFFNFYNSSLSMIMILTVFSLSIYPIMLAGWSSMNKYSFLGAIRGIAQTISYEVTLALILIFPILWSTTINVWTLKNSTMSNLAFPLLMGIWLMTALAESSRTPFDFAEGESELVSGFNTEFSSSKFALIFMAEYASIFFLSALSVILFIDSKKFFTPILITCLVSTWVWVRTTFPRHRFDFLMILNWTIILPMILMIFMCFSIFFVL